MESGSAMATPHSSRDTARISGYKGERRGWKRGGRGRLLRPPNLRPQVRPVTVPPSWGALQLWPHIYQTCPRNLLPPLTPSYSQGPTFRILGGEGSAGQLEGAVGESRVRSCRRGSPPPGRPSVPLGRPLQPPGSRQGRHPSPAGGTPPSPPLPRPGPHRDSPSPVRPSRSVLGLGIRRATL